ncbi:MAG: CHAT domain-containing protein, partial [Bacteroidota bacterium]
EITATFYEYLADGASKPQALHQAQLDYLQRDDLPTYLKSPYYWAALTYYGDAGTMPAPGTGMLWWLVLGGIVLVAIAWLVLLRR